MLSLNVCLDNEIAVLTRGENEGAFIPCLDQDKKAVKFIVALYFPKCTGDLQFLRYFWGIFFFLKDEHILQDHQRLHLNTA